MRTQLKMSVPCEVVVKCVLPVVRAMVAKELIENHDFRQAEAAKVLGVSQPAISLYSRNIRGRAINLENDREVSALTAKMAELLAKGNPLRSEVVPMYCKICRTVRTKGLMCELHKSFEPVIETENCNLCKEITNQCP